MASAEDSGQLTRKQIVRLSAAISANNIMRIAEGYQEWQIQNFRKLAASTPKREPIYSSFAR